MKNNINTFEKILTNHYQEKIKFLNLVEYLLHYLEEHIADYNQK